MTAGMTAVSDGGQTHHPLLLVAKTIAALTQRNQPYNLWPLFAPSFITTKRATASRLALHTRLLSRLLNLTCLLVHSSKTPPYISRVEKKTLLCTNRESNTGLAQTLLPVEEGTAGPRSRGPQVRLGSANSTIKLLVRNLYSRGMGFILIQEKKMERRARMVRLWICMTAGRDGTRGRETWGREGGGKVARASRKDELVLYRRGTISPTMSS